MTDNFDSLYIRERAGEARIHTELTDKSRERLTNVMDDAQLYIYSAYDELADEVGRSRINEHISGNVMTLLMDFEEFMENAPTLLVLSFIEHLFREAAADWTTIVKNNYSPDKPGEVVSKIKKVLITEGLLWDIHCDYDNYEIRFERLASEQFKEIDDEIQHLSKDDRWSDALKGYDAAIELYIDGAYSKEIPEKLYNSIEEVLKTICVDLEDWENNRERNHSHYLDLLKENEVYNANGITAPEVESLLDAMEKLVSKIGADRKQRHQYIDRHYSTLLIHQAAAYLTFLIKRYEEYASDNE